MKKKVQTYRAKVKESGNQSDRESVKRALSSAAKG